MPHPTPRPLNPLAALALTAAALTAPALTAPALTAVALIAPAAASAAPAAPPAPDAIQTATVQITVTNIATATGQIRLAICPRTTFLHAHCPYQAQTQAQKGAVTLTVQNIPPGTYAAQAFHDVNGNNRLDRTLLGLPAEPMGFSNNAPLHFGPPSFAAAAFTVTAPLTRLTFALRAY